MPSEDTMPSVTTTATNWAASRVWSIMISRRRLGLIRLIYSCPEMKPSMVKLLLVIIAALIPMSPMIVSGLVGEKRIYVFGGKDYVQHGGPRPELRAELRVEYFDVDEEVWSNATSLSSDFHNGAVVSVINPKKAAPGEPHWGQGRAQFWPDDSNDGTDDSDDCYDLIDGGFAGIVRDDDDDY